MARGPEIPNWIEYHQNPSQPFLIDGIYNASSVYLGASIEEGWGLPPAEAMACGCAFVGTDIGGFREFARSGRNALLSPARDPRALAANLVALSDDPSLRARLQRAALDTIGAFTWDRAGSAFVRCLELAT
jgi:glycosyltransferase involved in cell wall biosynthesis